MTSAARPTFPRLTFPQLWVALAILLPVLAALIATMSTVDLAYNVRAGELMLDQGAILRTDPFTFTAGGGAWLDQQWGAQVLLALIYRAGGWVLLDLVRALLVAAIIGLVFRACRASGAGLRVAAWLAIGTFVLAAAAMGMRPQIFGMALFAVIVAILAGRSRPGRPAGLIWLIPVLVVPWASVHGSFFLAPAAVGIAWLEDLVTHRPGARRLLAVAVVSGLTALLNPFGIGVWTYTIGLSTNPTIRRLISEWQPTSPFSATGVLLYGSMLVFAIILIRRLRSREIAVPGGALIRSLGPTLLWLVFLGVVAVSAQRGIAWWAIAAPVAVARLLYQPESAPGASPVPIERMERASPLNGAIVVVLALVGVLLLPFWRSDSLLTDDPPGITVALVARATPSDRVWNAQRWGSWFELALPGIPMAVDSRIEVIPTAAWDDHLALSAGASDWATILDRWKVTIVVASRDEQTGLIPLISASPAWATVYQDADGLVFVRR